jgi:site-specific recombinase
LTQTVQYCSWAFLNETGKPETEENMRLLLSVYDSLNNLYERLSRLNYVIERKNLELSLYHKCKERRNEN